MNENILYTFRRCPYAMRARWALIMSNTVFIWREVLLRDKPRELLEISSKGTVPVLLTSKGEVIDESVEIMKWSLRQKNNFDIIHQGNEESGQEIKNLINTNDNSFKYHLDRYKYSKRYIHTDREYHKNLARQILLDLNARLSSGNTNSNDCWLVQSRETLADWAIWPFVRQYRIADPKSFDEDNQLEVLRLWLKYYSTHPKFELLMYKSKPWNSFEQDKYYPSY